MTTKTILSTFKDEDYNKLIELANNDLLHCVTQFFIKNESRIKDHSHGSVLMNVLTNFLGNMAFSVVKEETGYPGLVSTADQVIAGVTQWFENALAIQLKELNNKSKAENH